MDDRELSKTLYSGVVMENLELYREMFSETSIDDAIDPYWKEALILFENLSLKERGTLFKIIKQVSIDTVSSVTGALDGSTEIGLREDVNVVSKSGKKLNGCLQEYFLGTVEENS